MPRDSRTSICTLIVMLLGANGAAQEAKPKEDKPKPPEFKWVNPLPEGKSYPGVKQATYHSERMDRDVGYCIYLPPGYDDEVNKAKRYPVVYYLHGGRPGSETKSVSLAEYIDEQMQAGRAPPMIYVFVNGGHVSHYDYPSLDSPGETTFITELIPHVDKTYRTLASREGRGLAGFSQGGRGTARHMCKHPELFGTAAPMGGGHQHEKRISESDGLESEGGYRFALGDNSYDLARKYAAVKDRWPLKVLVVVGTEDFNYEANLDYLRHLEQLGIPHERIIVEDAPHSAKVVHEKAGPAILKFFAKHLAPAE